MAEDDERIEELGALGAIFPELETDLDTFTVTLELPVSPSKPLLVRFMPEPKLPQVMRSLPATGNTTTESHAKAASNDHACIERVVQLSHLPPLRLRATLPEDYPATSPPDVHLSTVNNWLLRDKLIELETEASKLWDEYGQCQILYTFIDFLQQAAERGFDLDRSMDGCLVLTPDLEKTLITFDEVSKNAVFNAGHYDCGICLEPKKGESCFQMKRCGHVFCLQCLQDFYNNAITEGDIAGIRCLDPTCGKNAQTPDVGKRKRKTERTLHPRELLAMGIDEPMVRRYVELNRKKRLEADKTTVYCPRTWCQHPAKSPRYPPIPADLASYIADDAGSDSELETIASTNGSPQVKKAASSIPPDPSDRLAICEKCSFAFCRVCYMGWHGPFARCFPRDPNELSAEEKASYDYIRLNTSPCPTCSSPTQKTMGCNHMKCFQCNTHFCYLCGSWLLPDNPYIHFNKPGTPCYQRLWELEEGDEGQGPEDGRGFAGGRGWEQMAIEAARQADEEEAMAAGDAEAAAREAQEEADAIIARAIAGDDAEVIAALRIQEDVNDDAEPPRPTVAAPRRRRRNPFPARPPAQGHAQAVRRHERGGHGHGQAIEAGNNPHDARIRRRPGAEEDHVGQRQQAELQRFLDLARRDEEDGWDSDELDDDDGRFVIR